MERWLWVVRARLVTPSRVATLRDSSSAVKFNQVLWTLIQSDLSENASRFPDDLKSDLLSLSLFVDRQTVKALSEPKAEHLEALIEIDRNIARGLRAQA